LNGHQGHRLLARTAKRQNRLFAARVGKTVFIQELINNVAKATAA